MIQFPGIQQQQAFAELMVAGSDARPTFTQINHQICDVKRFRRRLNADPFEERNLFDDPAQKDRIRDMAARVRLWQFHTGDSAPLPSV